MTKIAIMYDFDLTLCTTNMQEYSLLPMLNVEPAQFWSETTALAQANKMDATLAFMYLMVQYAKKNNCKLTRELCNELGKDIEYFPGVETFFQRINEYACQKGITIEHYVISSGTREIIEGSSIAKEFREIYACQFHYDENGEADWPALAINYTGKTQFLFRINKNCLDVSDNITINLATDKRDVPFTNMIYIADGFTDVPCMRLVKDNGGNSIAVYSKNASTYKQLIKDNRVNYVAKADYSDGSDLDNIIKTIIDKIAIDVKLEKYKN